MASIDLKKTYREHYTVKAGTPVVVEVPVRRFLMIDGTGDPNTSTAYRNALAALYPLAYGLRAAVKTSTGDAYTVMPLEGLWWVPDMARFSLDDKADWRWTAMICVPEAVTDTMAGDVLPMVTAKKQLVAGERARVEGFGDGPSVQVLHTGPYAAEGPTIAELHAFINDHGYSVTGKHHEIYLSDPNKTDPTKLRTIIRQPITHA